MNRRKNMFSRLSKAAMLTCALVLSVCMFGCGQSSTTGSAALASSVQARTQDEMNTTAAQLDKQSDNDTMGQTGAKAVKLGQTITTERYAFTLTSYKYLDEIKPGASGATAIYQDEAGKKYLIVSGTYTNRSSATQNIRKGTAAWFTFGKVFSKNRDAYGIQGWTDAVQSDKTAFSNYIVAAGQTVNMFIYAEVPDSVAAKASSAKVLWGFDKDIDGGHYEANTEAEAYDITVY